MLYENNFKIKIIPLLLSIVTVFLTSCTQYKVSVDSISTPQAKQKTRYVLNPAHKGVNADNLEYQEFARYTDRALALRGFTKAASVDEANLAVLLEYGRSDPHFYEYTYSTPIYGRTGVESSSTYGSVNTYAHGASYSESTTYKPSYGVVGSQINVGTGVLYYRYCKLTGIDVEKYKLTGKMVELWRTTVTSIGSSDDFRRVFPILIGASKDYIAMNTGKKWEFSISEDHKNILEIKGMQKKRRISPTNKPNHKR